MATLTLLAKELETVSPLKSILEFIKKQVQINLFRRGSSHQSYQQGSQEIR